MVALVGLSSNLNIAECCPEQGFCRTNVAIHTYLWWTRGCRLTHLQASWVCFM